MRIPDLFSASFSVRFFKWMFLATIIISAPVASSYAETGTMRFAAPKHAEGMKNVQVFLIDGIEQELVVEVPITAGWNATQKRDEILKAVKAADAALPQATGWTFAANEPDGFDVTVKNGRSLVMNFAPRMTKEDVDKMIVVPSGDFRRGHGKMDPHSPSMSLYEEPGIPAQFNAGVTIGATDYLITLYGNDDAIDGDPSDLTTSVAGSQVAFALYNELVQLNVPDATFSLDSDGIGVDFAAGPSSFGIIWGTTSPTGDDDNNYGYNGSLSLVPEPGFVPIIAWLALTLAARRGHRVV